MKTIKGVSFDEYAAISANIAQGMSVEEILRILELDQSTFDEMMKEWEAEFANLMAEDINLAARFGEIFSNPQVGRFSGKSKQISLADLQAKVPDSATYLDIFFEHEAASKAGVPSEEVLNKYEINLAEFVELNKLYPFYIEGDDEGNELRTELSHCLRAKWEEVYSK